MAAGKLSRRIPATVIPLRPALCARSRRLAATGATIVFVLGFCTLIGWAWDYEPLKALFGYGVTMKANAAIGLSLAGLALAFCTFPAEGNESPRRIGTWVALIPLLIGGLTLAENITGRDLGIDQLFFHESVGAAATGSPGRMGFPGSIGIFLSSVAIFSLDGKRRSQSFLVQTAAVTVVLMAVVPILGYAYSIDRFYRVPKYTGIAAHTAVALFCLGLSILLAKPRRGIVSVLMEENAGGLMARRLLLPAMGLPLVVWWFRLMLENAGYIDAATGRVFAILVLSVCSGLLIINSARNLSRVEEQKLEAQRERQRARDKIDDERVIAERALRLAKDEAERASRAKSEFIATLSHELRTPLAPVTATLSLLEANPHLPPDVRRDLQVIRRNVAIEVKLISDLLDLTRAERGKIELELEVVDLHEILRSVVAMCATPGALQPQLHLSEAPIWIQGDSVRLHQVFWNLLSNAQRFTPPTGQITLTSARVADERVLVTLSDDGAGITAELMARLFTPFEQGDSSHTTRHSGLGLGLAISKRIVEIHGGKITAFSAGSDRGTTLTVDLKSTAAPAPVKNISRPNSTSNWVERHHILLVEDHEATRVAMSKLLQMLGHQVTTAASCAEARLAARSGNCNFLISDLGLPDGNGIDLMRELRHQFEGRAVALSGFGMESDVQAAHEAGFTTHLTKPVELARLRSALIARRPE